MDKRKQGLFEKYYVERLDGKPMVSGCIVLEWQDKNARAGIKAFADAVRKDGYTVLADELEERLKVFSMQECENCNGTGKVAGIAMGEHSCFCQYDHVTDASLADDAIQRVSELMSENTTLRDALSSCVYHLEEALMDEENGKDRILRVAGYAAAIQSAKVLLRGGE